MVDLSAADWFDVLAVGALVGSLPRLVLALLRIDERDAPVTLPEAHLNVDADVIGFARFRVELNPCRLVGRDSRDA